MSRQRRRKRQAQTRGTNAALIADGAGGGGHGLLIGALAAGLLLLIGLMFFAHSKSAPQAAAAGEPTSHAAPSIRIGFYLSHPVRLKTIPARASPPATAMLTLKELTDPDFDVIPVVEPNTADLGELPNVLSEYFPGKPPLNVASIDDLKTLDVIIAGGMHVPADALDAIEKAVEGGMGLMTRNRFAIRDPSTRRR
jgi:hypothetical protein